MRKRFAPISAGVALLASSVLPAYGQWVDETIGLKAGWNGVFSLVDASDVTLDELLAGHGSIEEVWRWSAASLDPTVLEDPAAPIVGTEWQVWKRGLPAESTLDRLLPNRGYLFKVAEGTAPFPLTVKGKAVLPRVEWRTDGLNLVGFPAKASPAPRIAQYLEASGLLQPEPEVFRYVGGPIENNPQRLFNLTFSELTRGEAMWFNTGRFSDYSGPIKVEVSLATGLQFGERQNIHRLILTNRSASAVDVTLTPAPSESDREGTSFPAVPLLERTFNPETIGFQYDPLNGPVTVNIPAGGRVARVIAVDRSSMAGAAGTRFASLLTVADTENLTEIHVPVSAEVASRSGLWLGEAVIGRVQNQLQQFQRDANGAYLYDEDGARIPVGGGESGLNRTAQGYPIRLIIHIDATGQARLLSTVYFGPIPTEVEGEEPVPGLATREAILASDRLADSTRLVSVHYPLDFVGALAGPFSPGGSLTGSVPLAHNDKVNPFVHRYHPDHDNLDARFENQLPPGRESYAINRAVTLAIDPGGDGSDPAWGSTILTGTYGETITGLHKNPLAVEGPFTLRRLSELDVLHQTPPAQQ